ncbi:interleukin-6 receptor subunit alpha [Dicentrarchus labrax]|uniref:interleukin-6 receptor subunit alpha n=1 Tax=Dicentrarchus labrax TaxID=13489 RepID=UPI0016329DFD|nr:interleukin-6 receptor subunit alpha [Dicentrarchus labrax]
MRIFLPLLCAVLCATPVHGVFDGECLREDPPPGVLVLSPGSKLVLTCGGRVMVDGVKVRNSSNTNRRGTSTGATPTTVKITTNTGVPMKSDKHTVETAVSEGYLNPTEAAENRSLGHTDTGYTASPTTHMIQLTSARTLLEAEGMGGEGDYEEEEEEDEEEEGEEGSRVTRGIKSGPQWKWKWNRRMVGKGDRDWGEISFERKGATLSLSSVRLTDSGMYTCYYRDRERFSIKVTVADPPENPSLSCFKKSPTSKIRCLWTPEKPVTIRPNCYLFLSKSPSQVFHRLPCSYSTQASRCWCALEHDEDERRTFYTVYLCVKSIAGNATSSLLHFTPLNVLKPEPPSRVSVRQMEGQPTRMAVTWGIPNSWKSHYHYYKLIYEIKYQPLKSSFHYEQLQEIEDEHSYAINDAMPGVEYLIQLRAKDQYDGLWSDWSEPVYASSWIAPTTAETTTMFLISASDKVEGSGDDNVPTGLELVETVEEVPHYVLWISGSFALLSCLVMLAVYILFRHRGRFMSKLRSLSVIGQCGGSPESPPSAPTPPEGQALMTFGPPRYKEPSPSEVDEGGEENEEEQCVNERTEAMHFNNTSYFFLPK